MRSIRRNKEAMGFAILTTLLSLTFIVSIVYAENNSKFNDGHGEKNPNVYYCYWVGNLRYDRATATTYSDHSIYISNGETYTVRCTYEFKHTLLENSNYHNTLYSYTDIPPGGSFPLFRTQLMGVGDLPKGLQLTLWAYTDIKLDGEPNKPGKIDDPSPVNLTLPFRR